MRKAISAVCAAGALFGASPALADVDIVEAPTGFFAPGTGATTDPPYYRWHDEDWGWTHGAIGGPIASASLFISAYDVDFSEIDNIYGYDNGVFTLIGSLTQTGSEEFSYTEFGLGANWFDDIAGGLSLWVDIDSTHDEDFWALTLGKSVLTTNGTTPPPPTPGAIPEPSTWLLMILGFGAIGGIMRARKRQTVTVSYA